MTDHDIGINERMEQDGGLSFISTSVSSDKGAILFALTFLVCRARRASGFPVATLAIEFS
ncbi:hypothetical protein COLO4_16086 [Corchorus olitorius]|uniref:Uncharacterized protein n=1 Tax=Corchorus olitorius TaxID=93759 RepID=A0A1R3JJL4_9ROSI|nr:hypothetical protein COLO4_16086 [Corchorus olitorius]